MLGYKRYIKFSSRRFLKSPLCKRCPYTKECKGIFERYVSIYGWDEVKPPGVSLSFTDLERCMIKILTAENNIPTERVLELARRFSICKGCSSGSHVIATGNKLVKKRMVKRTFRKGKYFWSLVYDAGKTT